MNFKLSTILFVIVVFATIVFANESNDTNMAVVEKVCKSHYICLDKHGQYNANITKNYELRFIDCQKYSSTTVKLKKMMEKIEGFSSSLTGLCNTLQCNQGKSAKQIFECFIAASDAGQTVMFDLNTQVVQAINELAQSYRIIDNTESKCTSETKEMLQKATLESNQHLSQCLANGNWTLSIEIGKFPPVAIINT